MPSSPEITPFTMVYTALWEMLLDHPRFARDVKEGNRIRFDMSSNRDPVKGTIADGDLPEVAITAQTVSANLQSTSHTSSCTRRYAILASTGDYRYTERLALVEWYIFVAMMGWQTRLSALTWKDRTFCKRLNLTSAASGLSDPQQNRNIVGWSAQWQVEIEMHFVTADLLQELRGIGE